MMELHVKSLEFDHVNVHFGLKRTTKQARFQVNRSLVQSVLAKMDLTTLIGCKGVVEIFIGESL